MLSSGTARGWRAAELYAISLPARANAKVLHRKISTCDMRRKHLRHEAGATDTADPLGGAYFLEELTVELEALALELVDRVEERGGAVAAIEQGFQKSEIERSAYQVTREIDSGERVIVGVNRFAMDVEDAYEPLRVDPAIEAAQAQRLATLRAERDSNAVTAALDELRTAAEGSDNVLVPLKKALALRATVGEVCDALREVWGIYHPTERF